MEDMGGTPWAVAFGESGDGAVVQQLDPFDGSVDPVAIADGEAGEAFVFFIPQGYLLPGLFLEALQSLVKVSNGLCVFFHIPVMDSISLFDGLDEGRGELTESDGVPDVKALYEVSCGRWRDGVDMGVVEIRDGHEDCRGSAGGLVWCHGYIGIGGVEWKGVG